MAEQYKQTSHVGHLIMSFLTGGLWILIWVWAATSNSRHNARLDREKQNEQIELMRKIAESKSPEKNTHPAMKDGVNSMEQQLAKLSELKEKGLITSKDYESKKDELIKEIVDRMANCKPS